MRMLSMYTSRLRLSKTVFLNDILPDSMEQCQLIVATEQDSYFQKILQTAPSKGTNRT